MRQSSRPFHNAARLARRRLLLARWFGLLRRTAAPLFVTTALLVVVWRLGGGRWSSPSGAAALVALWLVATAAWACLHRPTLAHALAVWDERAGRHEAFLSALCFEAEREPDDGQRLHLARAQRQLDADRDTLPRLVPLTLSWMLLLPAAFFGLSTSRLFIAPLPAEDRALGAQARARAADEADELAEEGKDLQALKALEDKEREAVDELKQSLEASAEKLKSLDQETQREVLKDLERRAREAEKLADALGGRGLESHASPMIAELARHAETADFAEALRASKLDQTADEAEKIADGLRSEDCTMEKHQRLEHALDRGLDAADENDKRTVVGRRLRPAHDHLEENERPEAAKEFDRIAEHFRRADERRKSQRRLRRLARRLRNAGQRIFGRKPMDIQRIPQQLAGDMAPLGDVGELPQRMFHLPPWTGELPDNIRWVRGDPREFGGEFPIPGLGKCRGDEEGEGSCLGMGAGIGRIPIPGGGQLPGAGANVGGLEAGTGSAPYGKEPTKPYGASSTEVVSPNAGKEGPSEVRFIDGSSHTEEAARAARDLAIQFIEAEEEALAEEPLPLSRRQQVLRYFTELRRRLEDDHRER